MAHFRGTVEGHRGEASRLGSKASGITVVAQSWAGQVEVCLYERDGVDYARITIGRNPAVYGGSPPYKEIAHGRIEDLRK